METVLSLELESGLNLFLEFKPWDCVGLIFLSLSGDYVPLALFLSGIHTH